MIDWWMLSLNGLWVTGLSTVLAGFSYHDWLARQTGRRRRDLFKERAFRLAWASGMFLTSVGWALSQAQHWWEKALWLVLAAGFVIQCGAFPKRLKGLKGRHSR